MKRTEDIKRLVADALDREPDLSVSDLVKRAARIARLQGDYRNIAWLERELLPYDATLAHNELGVELRNYIPALETFRPQWDADTNRLLEERSIPLYDAKGQATGKTTYLALSVPDMEQALGGIKREIELSAVIPDGLMPGHIASYIRQQTVSRIRLNQNLNDRQSILNRIRHRVVVYLNQVEAFVEYQEQSADVFESARRIVETELSAIAPDVLTKFTAAQERLIHGTPEAFSHALDTCRRVLKTFADAVYPPVKEPVVGADGKKRILDEEHYVARLWQYVYETTGKHTGPELALDVLDHLGKRIDRVYALASKGVHDDVVEQEAKQCVIQTFLVLADVLAYRKVAQKVEASKASPAG